MGADGIAVIRRPLLAQGSALIDAKTVLFVNDNHPQTAEVDRRLDKSMGADEYLDRPGSQSFVNGLALGGRCAAGQQGHLQTQRLQQGAQAAVVLLSQDLGRRHQGRLRASPGGRHHGRRGDDGLARTNVSLQQTVHRPV